MKVVLELELEKADEAPFWAPSVDEATDASAEQLEAVIKEELESLTLCPYDEAEDEYTATYEVTHIIVRELEAV